MPWPIRQKHREEDWGVCKVSAEVQSTSLDLTLLRTCLGIVCANLNTTNCSKHGEAYAGSALSVVVDADSLILTSSSLGVDKCKPSCCLVRSCAVQISLAGMPGICIYVYQLALQLYLLTSECGYVSLYASIQSLGFLTFVQVGSVNSIAVRANNGDETGNSGIGITSGTGYTGVVSPGDSSSCPWDSNGCTNQDLGEFPPWRSSFNSTSLTLAVVYELARAECQSSTSSGALFENSVSTHI